jgi:hypothetical protein
MTFREALGMMEGLIVSGGQTHADETERHTFRSASWTDGDTRIEVSVRVEKPERGIDASDGAPPEEG